MLCIMSRTQPCVILSTAEAGYVAMTERIKDSLFVRSVLLYFI